jgi:hypothetical protein
MSPALTALVLQLIQLGIQVAPQIISAAQTEIALIQSGGAPTAEQQAAIDAALDAAHAALQAGVPAVPLA